MSEFEEERKARIDWLLAEGELTQEQADAVCRLQTSPDAQRVNDEVELRILYNQIEAGRVLRDADGKPMKLFPEGWSPE